MYRAFVSVKPDGYVSVTMPSIDEIRKLESDGMTMQEAVLHIQQKDAPNSVMMKPTVIGQNDATFLDAWKLKLDNSGIDVHMPKAKEIAHDKRRTRRSALFQPLDVEATIPAKAAQAEAARQAIRDNDAIVQASIDAATTPEQLKQILVEYQAI